MQDNIEDNIGGKFLVDCQTANILEAELELKTDTISELNLANGVTFVSNVYMDQDLSIKDLRIVNSTRDGYVSLSSTIDPGTTYNIILPSVFPTDNDVLVYNGTTGESEWTRNLDLNDLEVDNNFTLTGTSGGLLVNNEPLVEGLGFGVSGQSVYSDSTQPLGFQFRYPYGSFYHYGVSNALFSTTSNAYQNIITINTTSVPPGIYKITNQFNYDSNRGIFTRVRLDGVDVINSHYYGSGGTANLISGMSIVTVTLTTTHTLTFDVASSQNGKSIDVTNSRLDFFRVSNLP